MTVKEITEAILEKACGSFRINPTCDRLMSGSFDCNVKGIATTFIVTPHVIDEAMKRNINFIITHEPTWFTGADEADWCSGDSVYLAKKKKLEDNGIAVWRFHDHMHACGTDLIYDGLIKELGWSNYRCSSDFGEIDEQSFGILKKAMSNWLYDIPETNLESLSGQIKRKLGMEHIRYVGNPDMQCSRIGILVGGGSLGLGKEQMPMQLMEQTGAQVILCGDITEWTLCSYVHDASQMGMQKAMIILGHERSEEAGMKYLPGWLENLCHGIPVSFIDSKEPFGYF